MGEQVGHPAGAQRGRPGRGLVITGVVLVALALVVGIGGVVAGFGSLLGGDPPTHVEGSAVIALEAGEEIALYRVDGRGEGRCTISGPDGQPVGLQGIAGTETLTRDGVRYDVVEVGTATQPGRHEVRCATAGFAIGPRLAVLGVVGAVLGGVFGGIALGATGIVLLVIGLSRRKADGVPREQITYGPGAGWQGQGSPDQGWPGQGWPAQGGPGQDAAQGAQDPGSQGVTPPPWQGGPPAG